MYLGLVNYPKWLIYLKRTEIESKEIMNNNKTNSKLTY